jgi:hypothetical protein
LTSFLATRPAKGATLHVGEGDLVAPLLGLQRRLGLDALLVERLVPLVVGLGLRDVRPRLAELRIEVPGVEAGEQGPLLDLLALHHRELDDLARHLEGHLRVLGGGDLAGIFEPRIFTGLATDSCSTGSSPQASAAMPSAMQSTSWHAPRPKPVRG